MGHRCCSKQKVKRGLWSPEEDEKLMKHITTHGHGSWSSVPKLAGLQRCGKSCRLRWINYLRPDLKKGSFTEEEEQIIIDVHRILGNRWAQIAKHLPGRTDNEVKNFWNSCIKKKLMSQGLDPQTHNLIRASNNYGNNHNKKNAVTSFVVSRESHDQPVSLFSWSSSSSSREIMCSDQDQVLVNPPHFDLTLPNYNAISTGDQHPYQNPSISSSNSSHIDNARTSNFQHLDVQNLSIDHDIGLWGSSFEPLYGTPRLEGNQQALQRHDHNINDDQQIKQIQHDQTDKRQNDDEGSFEKYSSFDLGYMESALMSDVMCTNDFSSMEYDIAWNY